MSIANASHERQVCDGFVIAKRSQNVASHRHRHSSSVLTPLSRLLHHSSRDVTRATPRRMMALRAVVSA